MTFNWADSFDVYAAVADMGNNYWTSLNTASMSFVAGRFTGSRALSMTAGGTGFLSKVSGQNDAVHHIVVSFNQTQAISGTTIGAYLALADGATFQCTIAFKSNGDILLIQGNSAGAVLDTYVGAVTTNNTWYGFEFEIVINDTTGSWAVRKNGNTVNDHAASGLNTRGGTANNYANRLQIGESASVNAQIYDDLYWQSGAATGTWLGDIRSYTRMPASDASVQFTKQSLVGQFIPTGGIAINPSTSATRSVYTPITMLYDGTIGQVIVAFVYTFTGNVKMALFANGANIPTTLLGAANVLTNPVIGNNVFTFPSPPSVSKGVQYWVGIEGDGTHASCFNGNSNQGVFSNQSYASFPTSNPSTGTGAEGIQTTVLVTPAGNYVCVYEAQQDGLTTTVQDANPGDADFYGLAPLAIVPNAVIATNLRAYAQKSDVGTRILAAQLKSGATTVATPNVVLNSPGFQWVSRMDVTDPNTGLAWSPTAIDVVQIGPQLIA